jgi:hypothetical protein
LSATGVVAGIRIRRLAIAQRRMSFDSRGSVDAVIVRRPCASCCSRSCCRSCSCSRTTLGADALFGSGLRSGFADSRHLPSYTQVNASLQQAFDFGAGLGRIDGRVSLLNMFDRRCELRDGTGIGVGAPQFGPRRSVYVSVTKSF